MRKSAKSQQFGAIRNTGRLPMAETPRREANTPSTEALQSPLGAFSQWAPCHGRECSGRATWGA
eukprot:1514921-Alexandrium_andersonii.AAC.1